MSGSGLTPLARVIPLRRGKLRAEMNTDLIGAWRRWLVAAGRPPSTVNLRVYQLTRFCESHSEPLSCTTEQLAGWLAAQGWAPETRRSWRAALVGFYRWGLAAVACRGWAPNPPPSIFASISAGQVVTCWPCA